MRLLSSLLCLLFFTFGTGQEIPPKKEMVHLINADKEQRIPGKYNGNILLSGNVKLEHKGTTLMADSAIMYQKENYVEAFSNVHMKNAKYDLSAQKLTYNANTELAVATEDVVLRDAEQTLYTDKLEYDRKTNKAYYNTGGTIVSKDNTINSKVGVYDVNTKVNTFDSEVVVNNKDYYITSENVKYNSQGDYIEFFDNTNIQSKKNATQFIRTDKGKYYLNKKEAFLVNRSSIHSEGKSITADTLYYDQIKSYGRGIGRVLIDDPKENRYIKGGFGEVFKEMDSAYVTKRALAVRAFEKDSLYLHADTLMAIGKDSMSYVKAYYNANFFKSNLSGKGDSIGFSESNGTISLFGSPVIWSDMRQVVGDTIIVFINMKYEQLDSIQVKGNAFASSKRDSIHKEQFNQVKSKNMSGVFVEERLEWVQAYENAQSLTYMEDEDKDTKLKELVGVNRSDCGIIKAKFDEGKLNIISCEIDQQSKFYPPEFYSKDMYFLPKFLWREKERFLRWQDIFIKDYTHDK